MNTHTGKLNKIPVIAAIVLLLITVIGLHLGNGYFTLLRIIVCGVAVYIAIVAKIVNKQHWMWIAGFIAILFNPIIPIYLGKGAWPTVDFLAAAIFFINIFALNVKENVFKIRAFRIITYFALTILSITVAAIGTLNQRPQETQSPQYDFAELRHHRDVPPVVEKNPEPTKVFIQGEIATAEFPAELSDEQIKNAIMEKYYNPVLSYKDDNIEAVLSKVYITSIMRNYPPLSGKQRHETVLVFEVDIKTVNKYKILNKLGNVLCELDDNFGNPLSIDDSEAGWGYDVLKPRNPFPDRDIRCGVEGKVVLCGDQLPLEGTSMLFLKIRKDTLCNESEIIFKIPEFLIKQNANEPIPENASLKHKKIDLKIGKYGIKEAVLLECD